MMKETNLHSIGNHDDILTPKEVELLLVGKMRAGFCLSKNSLFFVKKWKFKKNLSHEIIATLKTSL